ncbi:FKBP12-associated protein [Lecanicillium sp. MT-2017a]|nr:FKBP12-associated protein [Lecanicillium sp. MT-2017a]
MAAVEVAVAKANGQTMDAAQQNAKPNPPSDGKSRGGRNRRNNRGRGGGAAARAGATATAGPGRRAFGGHLTTSADQEQGEPTAALSLSADAPEFVPGKPVVSRSKPQKQAPSRSKQPAIKLPKSTAADLGTRIHEDISNSNYECAICTDDVLRTSHVWSCTLCWTVVHLKCAKRWHDNQMKQQELQASQPQRDASWRCPGCNSKLSDNPGTYHYLLEAATNMPSPVSAAMSRRTMPSMWANGTDPDVFLRQERIKKALPRNRLREWLELPRSFIFARSFATAMASVKILKWTAKLAVKLAEVRCLASNSNPDPERPEIKCDDECLRLERNRRLAAALNIDPATHTNDHVPYSETTLRLFKESTTWCEAQEREFRVFAQSANEIRMRYKPMPNNQRQFLHVLADDYGLESRSEDIEPHRYVLVFKGPRFVSAPSKTLAQCIKIRATQAAEAAAAAAASAPPSPPLGPVLDPLNAMLLTSPRFGLTVEEVTSSLAKDLSQQPSITFKTAFLPSDEVLIRATVQYSSFMSPAGVEKALITLQASVAQTVRKSEIAGHVFLCHVDEDNHITRRDDLRQDAAGGWSAVAGRAAAKKESSFSEEPPARTGGRRLLGLKKKRVADKEADKPWASQLNSDVEC